MMIRIRQLKIMMFPLFLFIFLTPLAHAQFFEVCRTGSVEELIENIKAHSEHIYRLDYKFDHVRYLQTTRLPPRIEAARLNDVLGFLDELRETSTPTRPRNAAALFYAYQQGRLCTWLMPSSRSTLRSHVATMSEEDLRSLRPNLIKSMRAGGKVNNRLPIRRGVMVVDEPPSDIGATTILERARKLLLPEPILREMLAEKIDTLIVVPVSNIGTLPFGAFSVGDKTLVDNISVVVAPSFLVFKEKPKKPQRDFHAPVVIGDPQGWKDPTWNFPQLPGARAEAAAVASYLKSKAMIGVEASKINIMQKIQAEAGTGLIFLSTHGVADAENPLDGSFLLLSDGRWTAREMGKVNLKGSRPLVVMSACQTGLGKDFDVGTIGMARAWQRAGASNVVMSLWSVDDVATRDLMVDFIKLARQKPPDKALQEAMQNARMRNGDPVLWAGFGVFGSPELW